MNHQPLDTVRAYLKHLHAGDTAALIATFEDDGLVHSPFLGTMDATAFFGKLAQASSASVITLIDLFASVQPATSVVRVAAYFRYDWTLSDGRAVDFTCVDVFSFRPGSARIQDMHIVYDTHPLREQVGDKYAPNPPALIASRAAPGPQR